VEVEAGQEARVEIETERLQIQTQVAIHVRMQHALDVRCHRHIELLFFALVVMANRAHIILFANRSEHAIDRRMRNEISAAAAATIAAIDICIILVIKHKLWPL